MQSSCSYIFLCTTILCWNNNYQKLFFNIIDCSPKLFYFRSNIQLISLNNKNFKIETSSFICFNCTQKISLSLNSNQTNLCDQQIKKIQLINSCQYVFQSQLKTDIVCQCFPSNQSFHKWSKALIKPGKSFQNINRINHINQSASLSISILIIFLSLILFFGGFISIMIFYWIKFQSIQQQILK